MGRKTLGVNARAIAAMAAVCLALLSGLYGTAIAAGNLARIACLPGDEFALDYWLKGDAASGPAGDVGLDFFDAAEAAISTVAIGAGTGAYDTQWRHFTGKLVTPARATRGHLRVVTNASATTDNGIWFDDIMLRLQVPVRFAQDRLAWEYDYRVRRYSTTIALEEAP